jgi:hypothetical protein
MSGCLINFHVRKRAQHKFIPPHAAPVPICADDARERAAGKVNLS